MHQAIYVPGLGDNHHTGQRAVLRLWRVFGARVYYLPLIWSDGEDFLSKLDRLLALIDKLHDANHQVSLIGVSAGASAVLNAFAERKKAVSAVVLIVGKVRNPQTVSERTYRRNPAFQQSMAKLEHSLGLLDDSERRRILSIRGVSDMSVPPSDTLIDGAVARKIPTFGHIPGIIWGITLGSYRIVRFLSKHSNKKVPA